MPGLTTTSYGGEDPERSELRKHFTERSSGWECGTCAAFVKDTSVHGPKKHLAWHEANGG